jgi:hypothetical protein
MRSLEILFTTFLGLSVGVYGCRESVSVEGTPLPDTRHAITSIYPQTSVRSSEGWILGPEGTKVGAVVGISGYPGGPGDIKQLVSKVEFDWGDGSGYEDVTQDAYDKWWRGGAGTTLDNPSFLTLHEYYSPGEFVIVARVTYGDGIVILDETDFRSRFRIGRYAIGFTWGITPVSFEDHVGVGPPGTEIGARLDFPLNILGRPGDDVGDVFTKAEIDWGDGSGFEDVTVDALAKWGRGPGGTDENHDDADDPDFLSLHTYDTPGEYTISGRITYWDGAVVTDDESTRSRLRIEP